MAATTTDRNTLKRGPIRERVYNVKTNEIIPVGVILMRDAVSVGIRNATDSAGSIVMGVSCQAVNEALDRGPTGIARIQADLCIVCLNNGGGITIANVGDQACVKDNQTVDLAAGTTNAIKAGPITDVDQFGVWVDMTASVIAAT